jgi:single-strand DNA-binding protein
MNRVTLIGRLGANPEMAKTSQGMAVAKFSIATNRISKGEKVTDWHRITLFDKKAELAEKYLVKGNNVCIEGVLTYNKYESDGAVKYSTNILGNHVYLIDRNENEVGKVTSKIDMDNIDDDLPF